MMAGSYLSSNRWSGAVFWMSLASALMSPSCTRLSQVARVVVSGGPVRSSKISVSYFVQSCSMDSTYITPVYGWMLCSARVRAWASSLYSVHRSVAGRDG